MQGLRLSQFLLELSPLQLKEINIIQYTSVCNYQCMKYKIDKLLINVLTISDAVAPPATLTLIEGVMLAFPSMHEGSKAKTDVPSTLIVELSST